MNPYNQYILPHLIDVVCGLPAFERKRAAVVPQARGRVLEIGFGSGRNLPHYAPDQIDELVVLDPDPALARLAQRRIDMHPIPVSSHQLRGEQLPFDDHEFDTVVMTYTLCSVDVPQQVLAEIRRVLKPGAALMFAEHGRAPDHGVRRWQDRLTPGWRRLAGNCHLNRCAETELKEAGFAIEAIDRGYAKGPKVLTWNVWGCARVPEDDTR